MKSLLLLILGFIILSDTHSKIGDIVGLACIGVGLLLMVIREIKLHRGE